MTTSTTRAIINVIDSGGGGNPPAFGENGSGDLYLPEVYEAVYFFVEFEFLIETTTEDPETSETTVSTSPASTVSTEFDFDLYGLTYTEIDNNTVKIEGPISNVFLDQFYQFVLPDMTEPVLPFDTDVPYYSLIKYQKPSVNQVLFEYDFLVNNTYNTIVNQWVHWSFETAKQNIEYTIPRGLA